VPRYSSKGKGIFVTQLLNATVVVSCSFRGAVGTPSQIADLAERYERAGVDLIIFAPKAGHNQHEHILEAIELLAKTVMPCFAARAVALESQKQNRLAAAVDRALERRASRHLVTQLTVSRYVITPQGEPGLAGTVWPEGRALPEERAFGLSGEIEYELRINSTSKKWVIRVAGSKATAHAGPAKYPAVVLRMSAPTLARVSAGILAPVTAVLERKIEAEGDLRLVNRLAEMFGGPPGY